MDAGRYDIVLSSLVAKAVASRALDAMWLGGTTTAGRPATRSHVIGSSVRVASLTAIGWLVAQSISL